MHLGGSKITSKVLIVGQGYVGLNLSVAAAKAGHDVIGFDTNVNLISTLSKGISHIEGISGNTLSALLKSSSLKFSNAPQSINDAEIVVIAVPTGLSENGMPDLSNLRNAVKLIANNLQNAALIINESTSYPGTLKDEISTPIRNSSQIHHLFASSPERVDPANSHWNLQNTPRLVAGENPDSLRAAVNFYSSFCDSIIQVKRPEEAEAAKLLENSFRLLNISFINEFSTILIEMGIDPEEVIEAASTKPYGFMKFTPSAGAGGHCIPIDPVYFQLKANEFSKPSALIEKALEINSGMTQQIIETIKRDHDGSLFGLSVNIIGLAYKPNVSDVRESPSINLHSQLLNEGALVSWHDPLVGTWSEEVSKPLSNHDIAILMTLHNSCDYTGISLSSYVYDTKKMKGYRTNSTSQS